MPEHLRALVVILALTTTVFVFAKKSITTQACRVEDYERRRNVWFALTLSAFLAHDFWLFLLIASLTLMLTMRVERNHFALFLGLVLVLPPISASISGLGVFNKLFAIHPVRLLALAVLLPAYLTLRRTAKTESFGRMTCDKLLLGYLGLSAVLNLPFGTFTNVLREAVFYPFVDIFLPYYVASRGLRTITAFRDALGAFIVGAGVLSLILLFEFSRSWLLFAALAPALGVYDYGWSTYLGRGDFSRASGTVGHSIAAGLTCSVAMGLYLYFQRLVPTVSSRRIGMLLLLCGLAGALARAPWVGAVAIVVCFVALGPAPGKGLMKLGLATIAMLPVLLLTGLGQRVLDLLPWVGTVDAANIAFRERLAEASFNVFLEAPFFGRIDVLDHPAMEALRGGDGLIDTVNTYAVVALRGGSVSLVLFAGFFLVAGFGLWRSMRGIGDHDDERHRLARALLATLIGMMLMIATVSPVLVIPTLYWCLGGMAVACRRLVEQGDELGLPSAAQAPYGQQPRRFAGAARTTGGTIPPVAPPRR